MTSTRARSLSNVTGSLAVVLALALAAACASAPVPYAAVIDAYRIVHRNASDALEVGFDTAVDGPALGKYAESIARATTREELLKAWRAIPALDAKGADFLTRNVFELARRDQRWPAGSPPDEVFAKGLRDALAEFLKGGGS